MTGTIPSPETLLVVGGASTSNSITIESTKSLSLGLNGISLTSQTPLVVRNSSVTLQLAGQNEITSTDSSHPAIDCSDDSELSFQRFEGTTSLELTSPDGPALSATRGICSQVTFSAIETTIANGISNVSNLALMSGTFSLNGPIGSSVSTVAIGGAGSQIDINIEGDFETAIESPNFAFVSGALRYQTNATRFFGSSTFTWPAGEFSITGFYTASNAPEQVSSLPANAAFIQVCKLPKFIETFTIHVGELQFPGSAVGFAGVTFQEGEIRAFLQFDQTRLYLEPVINATKGKWTTIDSLAVIQPSPTPSPVLTKSADATARPSVTASRGRSAVPPLSGVPQCDISMGDLVVTSNGATCAGAEISTEPFVQVSGHTSLYGIVSTDANVRIRLFDAVITSSNPFSVNGGSVVIAFERDNVLTASGSDQPGIGCNKSASLSFVAESGGGVLNVSSGIGAPAIGSPPDGICQSLTFYNGTYFAFSGGRFRSNGGLILESGAAIGSSHGSNSRVEKIGIFDGQFFLSAETAAGIGTGSSGGVGKSGPSSVGSITINGGSFSS
jgi:hypothetical protein